MMSLRLPYWRPRNSIKIIIIMILSSDYVQLGSTCTHYFLWPFEVSDCFILALPANGDLSRRERPPP